MGNRDGRNVIDRLHIVEGKMTIEVIDPLTGKVRDRRTVGNIMCNAGLALEATAIALVLGTNIPTVSDPTGTFGAIGGTVGNPPGTPGTVTPAITDTVLASEIARNYVTSYGSSGLTFTLGFPFGFPPGGNQYKINEAGVFLGGEAIANVGSLLDHAVISPTITQLATEISVLSVVFTLSDGS